MATQEETILESRKQIEEQEAELEKLYEPFKITTKRVKRTDIDPLTRRSLRAAKKQGRAELDKYRQALNASKEDFEMQVAKYSPQFASPQQLDAAYNSATAFVNKQITTLQDRLETINKNKQAYIDWYQQLSSEKRKQEKENYKENIIEYDTDLNAVNAKLDAYKNALTGNKETLVKNYYSGYLNDYAQNQYDIQESYGERQMLNEKFRQQVNSGAYDKQIEALGISKSDIPTIAAYNKAIENYKVKAETDFNNYIKDFEKNNPGEKLVIRDGNIVGVESKILGQTVRIEDYQDEQLKRIMSQYPGEKLILRDGKVVGINSSLFNKSMNVNEYINVLNNWQKLPDWQKQFQLTTTSPEWKSKVAAIKQDMQYYSGSVTPITPEDITKLYAGITAPVAALPIFGGMLFSKPITETANKYRPENRLGALGYDVGLFAAAPSVFGSAYTTELLTSFSNNPWQTTKALGKSLYERPEILLVPTLSKFTASSIDVAYGRISGKYYPVENIRLLDGTEARAVNVKMPDGTTSRMIIVENLPKKNIVEQIKNANLAKGIVTTIHAAPEAIKLVNGKLVVNIDRGLYTSAVRQFENLIKEVEVNRFKVEGQPDIIVSKLVPTKAGSQALTYYTKGLGREIGITEYLIRKASGEKLKIGSSNKPVFEVFNEANPTMPKWQQKILTGKKLNSSELRTVEYWSKRFDAANKGKLLERYDKAGNKIIETPDQWIKSYITAGKKTATAAQIKYAKAMIQWSRETGIPLIGGPELQIGLQPYGPEEQLIQPKGKTFSKVKQGFTYVNGRRVKVRFFEPDVLGANTNLADNLIGKKEIPKIKAAKAKTSENTMSDYLTGRKTAVRRRSEEVLIRKLRLNLLQEEDLKREIIANRLTGISRTNERARVRSATRSRRSPLTRINSRLRRSERVIRTPNRLISRIRTPRAPTLRPIPNIPRTPRTPTRRPPITPPTFKLIPTKEKKVYKKKSSKKGKKKRKYVLEPTLANLFGGKRSKPINLAEVTGFEAVRV